MSLQLFPHLLFLKLLSSKRSPRQRRGRQGGRGGGGRAWPGGRGRLVGVAWPSPGMNLRSVAQPHIGGARSRALASRPRTISSCAEQTHKWPELSVFL